MRHKQFPSAGRQDHTGGRDANFLLSPAPQQWWNWLYQILPYIEQSATHEKGTTAEVRLTPIRAYFCPSRRPQTIVGAVIVCDYAGNAGINWCPADRVESWNGVIIPGMLNNVNIKLEPITTSKVLDGTSNSLMLGEKFVCTDHYASVLQWGDNESWAMGNRWGTHAARHSSTPPGHPLFHHHARRRRRTRTVVPAALVSAHLPAAAVITTTGDRPTPRASRSAWPMAPWRDSLRHFDADSAGPFPSGRWPVLGAGSFYARAACGLAVTAKPQAANGVSAILAAT